MGIPWQSSGQDSTLSLQRARVQSLVGELKSHKPCDVAKNNPKTVERTNGSKGKCQDKSDQTRDFLGGAVVKNLCQFRGHEFNPWSGKIPHAAEQLSPCATTTGACMPGAPAPQQEKQPQ